MEGVEVQVPVIAGVNEEEGVEVVGLEKQVGRLVRGVDGGSGRERPFYPHGYIIHQMDRPISRRYQCRPALRRRRRRTVSIEFSISSNEIS